MLQDPNSPNPPQKQSVDSKFARYALAGSALLGLPVAAQAAIVYQPGPFHVDPGGNFQVNLDPLIDSTMDLQIWATVPANQGSSQWIYVTSDVIFDPNGRYNTTFTNNLNPLSSGDPITLANTTGSPGTLMKATFPGPTYSFPWANVENGSSHYLGFKFIISGQPHLGWVELSMEKPDPSFTVLGYAWETSPGVSIQAGETPEPSSLLLFAAGAAGIAALRRKRRA